MYGYLPLMKEKLNPRLYEFMRAIFYFNVN